MVRKGSPVRVRKRAPLKDPRTVGGFVSCVALAALTTRRWPARGGVLRSSRTSSSWMVPRAGDREQIRSAGEAAARCPGARRATGDARARVVPLQRGAGGVALPGHAPLLQLPARQLQAVRRKYPTSRSFGTVGGVWIGMNASDPVRRLPVRHVRPTPAQSSVSGRIRCGDNLELLNELEPGSVRLVYMDPPFNTRRHYDHHHDAGC